MKKKVLTLLAAVVTTTAILAGCSVTKTKSLTYEVETGDNIKVTLDTSDGYSIQSDLPFTITKDGSEIMSGTFVTDDGYEYYVTEVTTEGSGAEVIDSGSKDGNEYTFYKVESDSFTEYDYILKVKDSQTGVIMGSTASEEEASKCFQAMTFSKE